MERATGRSGHPVRGASLLCGAFLPLACLPLSGCMAMRLSGRGAPDSSMREITVDLAPVDLPAHAMGQEQHSMTPPVWARIPESGWIHAWSYTLTDATGKPVPPGVLHHFKVLDPDARELFSQVMLHVVAAGAETAPVTLPRNIGFRVEAGDSLLVSAMLHNPTHADLVGVHLRVTLRYSPEGPWVAPLDVMPFFAHVASDWESVSYDVPPGWSQQTVEIKPAIGGRVLALGGHLHRYGRALRLQSEPDGKVIWEGHAKLAEDGTVLDIPQDHFVWTQGPELEKGHAYRVTAEYDNPTGETIVGGGMATLAGVLVPGEPWPSVDRASEEYKWYLARELGGMKAPHTGR